ncbi:hypothetical protein [Bacillus pseudomycoides]|uniref:hypothetical protein n=1 Tax=Bacillus pseudomycoides TaxID=64104 RepID=UPI0020D25621|nr:hypothetical protein [Bacillus pseudomycoides]
MKRKYLAKAGVFALAAGIILPSTVAHGEALPSSVSASTANVDNAEIDDVSVEVYDKDGNLVKTYSKEELEKFNQDMAKTPLGARQRFLLFGATHDCNLIEISLKHAFYNK